jgi:hypothetical protein
VPKLPSFAFYPKDWLNDPELSRCSLAARGVWADLLCLMFQCEERGVLSTGGKPWSDQEIGAAIRGDTQEVLSCLRELADKGVASRTESGALFSKRMVRDEEERRRWRARQYRHRHDVTGDVTHYVTPMSRASSSPILNTNTKTRGPTAPAPPRPAEHRAKIENRNRRIESEMSAIREASAGLLRGSAEWHHAVGRIEQKANQLQPLSEGEYRTRQEALREQGRRLSANTQPP